MKLFKLAAIAAAFSVSFAAQAKNISDAVGAASGESTITVNATVPPIFKLVNAQDADLSPTDILVIQSDLTKGGLSAGEMKLKVASNQQVEGVKFKLKESVELQWNDQSNTKTIPVTFTLGATTLVAGTDVELKAADLFEPAGASKELTLKAKPTSQNASRWHSSGVYSAQATFVITPTAASL